MLYNLYIMSLKGLYRLNPENTKGKKIKEGNIEEKWKEEKKFEEK